MEDITDNTRRVAAWVPALLAGLDSLIAAGAGPGRAEVVAQLRSIGVAEGGVLLVHTSFRAVRPIEGGPLDLVEALGLQFEGLVGRAHARLARSRDIVAAAVESLRTDPLLFLHAPGVGCAECDEARASVHGPE